MSNNNGPAYDFGCYVGLLTIAFIVLKLCGRITWPWVWVLSPIWIAAALVIIVTIIVFLVHLWRS
jgi:hypothetical protein